MTRILPRHELWYVNCTISFKSSMIVGRVGNQKKQGLENKKTTINNKVRA